MTDAEYWLLGLQIILSFLLPNLFLPLIRPCSGRLNTNVINFSCFNKLFALSFFTEWGCGAGGTAGIAVAFQARCSRVCFGLVLPGGKEASPTRSIILLGQRGAAQGSASAWATARIGWVQGEWRGGCPAGLGRQSRCLRLSEQGGLPLPLGPGERRRNKTLHFDGSSPISSIYSVSIAGAQQRPWQQLLQGSHLLPGCALPSKKENEEGDRERERKREREGGRVGKEKGEKNLADTGHNLIFTVPGQLYRVICHGMPLKLQCLYWPRRETQTVESLLKRSGDLSRFMSLS